MTEKKLLLISRIAGILIFAGLVALSQWLIRDVFRPSHNTGIILTVLLLYPLAAIAALPSEHLFNFINRRK